MVKVVRWTREADISYLEMIDFIQLVWNKKIVKRFIKETFDTLETISENPEMYIAFGTANVRRALIHPTVSMIYKINSDHIEILLFLDNRRNPDVKEF